MFAGCAQNPTHRSVIITTWCDGCRKWHSKLSLQRSLGSSSRLWEPLTERAEDDSQESLEAGFRPLVARDVLLELQRLYVEEEAGIKRLF